MLQTVRIFDSPFYNLDVEMGYDVVTSIQDFTCILSVQVFPLSNRQKPS